MTFRQRLVLFLIVSLIGVQGLTALSAYGVVRSNLVEKATQELQAAAGAFTRQLDILSERVTDDVFVLSLDYALRKAVAEQDLNTALSALGNHGRRVGATRMLLVDLDGKITADTTSDAVVGTSFLYTNLLADAVAKDQGTALVALGGGIFWIVVVPVKAPVAVAFIAAAIPVDAPLLERIRSLSATPHSLALATIGNGGGWTIISQSGGTLPRLPAADELPALDSILATENGNNLTMTARLETAENSEPVIAVLDYPLEEILGAYRAVITPMLALLAGALIVALLGAVLIARSVSRPLEALAAAAGRIAKGDYSSTPELQRRDELGQLSSALKKMSESIAERESALMSAVNSLEVARGEAVRVSEAKSQFLSNMSHELRTPLNAIIGFSEMIHREVLGPVGTPKYADYARDIHDSGDHLLIQVGEMLDLAETSIGTLTLAQERFSLGAMLDEIVASLDDMAAKAGVVVEIHGNHRAWPPIEGDADKLRHGLQNLVDNAIKFSLRGGTVTLTGEMRADTLHVRIADTGIGIADEDIELITLPFHRRKKAFDGTHQGAGIGLPFANAIVALHGGRLKIESTQGEGTVVSVTLPLPGRQTRESMEDAA